MTCHDPEVAEWMGLDTVLEPFAIDLADIEGGPS